MLLTRAARPRLASRRRWRPAAVPGRDAALHAAARPAVRHARRPSWPRAATCAKSRSASTSGRRSSGSRGIADVFLVHDRPIAAPRGRLRRARAAGPRAGPAPRARLCAAAGAAAARAPPVLARRRASEEHRALTAGAQVFVSQHIGDLKRRSDRGVRRACCRACERLYHVTPGGRRLRPASRLRVDAARASALGRAASPRVQHHHAHLAACMADNDVTGRCWASSWDGTGYGTDGTVWGGEFLLTTPRASRASRACARSACRAATAPCASRGARRSGCCRAAARRRAGALANCGSPRFHRRASARVLAQAAEPRAARPGDHQRGAAVRRGGGARRPGTSLGSRARRPWHSSKPRTSVRDGVSVGSRARSCVAHGLVAAAGPRRGLGADGATRCSTISTAARRPA